MGTNDKNSYTLEFYSPISKKRHTEQFSAKDAEAVKVGKEIFLDYVRSRLISQKSTLKKIYRTPENLLEKSCKAFIKKGEIVYSLREL